MKLESLATLIMSKPLSCDAALHLFLRLIIELEALHVSGKYAGNISLSTVLYSEDSGRVKFSTRARAHENDSLETAQVGDIKALGLVMFAVLNGNAALEAVANSSSADLYLPLDVPVWLSIIVRRMIRGDEDLSISEIRRLISRNMNQQAEVSNLGSWSEDSSNAKSGLDFSSRPSVVNLLRLADRRVNDSLVMSFLPHFALLLVAILAGVGELEWHVASLGVLIPFFVLISLVSFLPLLILKAVEGDLAYAMRHWLRGSFYLSIWMLISYLGTVMYIDIAAANNDWPNTASLESATWTGAAVVSIESVIHGVVLAPAVPEVVITENLISGGISHNSVGKSLIACYVIFVIGFIFLAIYYSESKVKMDYLRNRAVWVVGMLAIELASLFILENTISLLPVSVPFELFSTEVYVRTIALFVGIGNIVVFWWFILSEEEEYSLTQRQY